VPFGVQKIQERSFRIPELLIDSVRHAIAYLKSELLLLLNIIKKGKQKSRKSTLEKIYFLSTETGECFSKTFG
jgi:hypothetical protein